jgi:hypothetical protein
MMKIFNLFSTCCLFYVNTFDSGQAVCFGSVTLLGGTVEVDRQRWRPASHNWRPLIRRMDALTSPTPPQVRAPG